jgi:hypothetical protein
VTEDGDFMRALITASFDPAARRLARHGRGARGLEGAEPHWFDGGVRAPHRRVGADVLIVSRSRPLIADNCRIVMIGCCRSDPVNVDLALAVEGHRCSTPRSERRCRRRSHAAFMLMLVRRMPAIDATTAVAAPPGGAGGDFLELYKRFTGSELGGSRSVSSAWGPSA